MRYIHKGILAGQVALDILFKQINSHYFVVRNGAEIGFHKSRVVMVEPVLTFFSYSTLERTKVKKASQKHIVLPP